MKTRWLPVVAVAIAAGAIVAYKQLRQDPWQGASRARPEVMSASGPSVLLFADPREADSADPCAEIFRLVRRVGARGLWVREFAPGKATDVTLQYRVTVEPTVLVLDASGREVARHEGESPETVAAIRSSLERLLPAR
jgi:hypothetical protein